MTNLIVKINGSTINGENGQEVFQNSLLKLIDICGEDAVISADLEGNCISTEKLRRQVKPKKIGKYYISINHGNPVKASHLDKLCSRLPDITIHADAVDI